MCPSVSASVLSASPTPVVDALLVAPRDGDFGALLKLSTPTSCSAPTAERCGCLSQSRFAGRWPLPTRHRACRRTAFAHLARSSRSVLVNGTAGFVVGPAGRTFAIAGVTVRDGKIIEIDLLADRQRLQCVDLSATTDATAVLRGDQGPRTARRHKLAGRNLARSELSEPLPAPGAPQSRARLSHSRSDANERSRRRWSGATCTECSESRRTLAARACVGDRESHAD